MKHTTYFNNFLNDHVNLDATRLALLEARVGSVYNALAADPVLGPLVKDKFPQGSWAHRTIIKPKAGGEFDADFLLLLELNDDWDGNPSAYPNAVYSALNRHPTYKSMTSGRKARCVYLQYAATASEVGCHLDIVPYLILPNDRHVIVNRDINDWEDTSTTGFADWVKERDEITGGLFRKVVRLMKYYKVEKGSFNGTRSVILTTLLGNQVEAWKKAVDPSCYADLPTALVKIVTDMSDWLQSHPSRPSISNPAGDGTNFDHRWTDETYLNFRNRMKACADKMSEALNESDKDTSIKLWREVFGTSFSPPGFTASASAIPPLATPPSRASTVSTKLGAAAATGSSLTRRPGQGG
jgi:hypothetical protein